MNANPESTGGFREAMMDAMETKRRVIEYKTLSDSGLRLRMGEMSAQEIRAVRAVLNAILPHNAGTQRPGTPDGSPATETRKPGSLK